MANLIVWTYVQLVLLAVGLWGYLHRPVPVRMPRPRRMLVAGQVRLPRRQVTFVFGFAANPV
jgi:hypothetical protein